MADSARDRLLIDLTRALDELAASGLRRRLRSLDSVNGAVVRIDGRDVVNWCSNDYLGLSAHPALAEAAARAAAEWGIGARASRLLSGTTRWHAELEQSLASWFGADAALVYPSGYLANLGTLTALCGPQDLLLVDRLAHASLIDAARATRGTLRFFRHNDPDHLASLLARPRAARRRFIVTEGLFSMDGDSPPLSAFLQIADQRDALLYLDDAHGAFALGKTGRGTPEAQGVAHERFLYMGTLGKALGCQGGFVIGPSTLIEFLLNRSRTFIYTTALAVPVAAAAARALRLLADEPQLRQQLASRADALHRQLAFLPQRPRHASHIVPVMVGSAARAVALSDTLWDRGIWAPPIRPPTVREGTARLRLGVTVLHTSEQIAALVGALREVMDDPLLASGAADTRLTR